MGVSSNVERWREAVVRLCPEYDPDVVLALIAVESSGDPAAHRLLSQFHGLLQMGRAAGIDAGLKDRGRKTTQSLSGNAELALEAWHDYVERYKDRHRGEPLRIALLWKAGPGYLGHVNARTDADMTWTDALLSAEERYGYSAREYLRRFNKFYDEDEA